VKRVTLGGSFKQDYYTRLGVTPQQVALAPRLDPLITELGGPDSAITLLRTHASADARLFLELWDLTPLNIKRAMPLEAFALGCGIGVERLGGLLVEASLRRGQEAAVIKLARSLPDVMEATVEFAKLLEGESDRRALEKMGGLAAQPKGASTVVNVFQQNAQVNQTKVELPSTDEVIRRLSDRMNAKMLNKGNEERDQRTIDAAAEPLALPQATSADTISPAEQLKRHDAREAIPVVRADWAAQQVEYLPEEDDE